jgi:hypothetical protein
VSEADIQEVRRHGVRLPVERDPAESKWHNRACYDQRFGTNEWFQSEWEREVWYRRVLQERAGELRRLERQVRYPLWVNGVHRVRICDYIADLRYEERQEVDGENGETVWTEVVEDAKGKPTPEYELKCKLMFACYGIRIRETKVE